MQDSRYAIIQRKTTKDDIENPQEVQDEIIPPLGSSLLLCGKSGSGKSTLLATLINDEHKRFYTDRFDKLFLFSPTAEGDDIQKQYGINSRFVYTDLADAPSLIKLIHDAQRTKVKEHGSARAPQYAIIFDDVIGDTKFMNSKEFTQCFYQTRHVNCTTFICTQHYKRVPRVCRMQANFVCFFRMGQSEVEMVSEEFAPPLMPKKQFMSMIDTATSIPYSFFTINMKVDWETRFRQNLYPVIPLSGGAVSKDFNTVKEKDLLDNTIDSKQDGGSTSRGKQTQSEQSRVQGSGGGTGRGKTPS
jgi:hypothetical protein